MAKKTVVINGNKVVIDMSRPKVQNLVAELLKACAERQFPIGLYLDHADDDGQVTEYMLVRILQRDGTRRAYLINTEDGTARNSRKVVLVQDPTGGENGRGYVTEIPAEKDRFFDPDNDGEFLDC